MTMWPLFGLELRAGHLTLAPLREADAMELAGSLPPDVEQDPSAYRFEAASKHDARVWLAMRSYWTAYGGWTVESWRLPFAVRHWGELVGVQTLEGDAFVQRRVVDTASYLAVEARRQGIGKAMRRAVLDFAFGTLLAEEAVTSAWEDNHASLGVSRALGYTSNGIVRHAHHGRVGHLVHMRLDRATWQSTGGHERVIASGFAPCRPLFGLDS